MRKINIAICEDKQEDASELCRLIRQSGISADILTYENTEVFLSAFRPGLFQLVFLDIYFDNPISDNHAAGIDAALKIREADADIWIVFTTISPDHASFGYKVRADRYLNKPLDKREVSQLMQRAAKHFDGVNDEIFVTEGRKRRSVQPREIQYIEVHNRKSVIHLQNETITSYITIDELENLLKLPSFLRCHRSYIVNMDYIDIADRDFTMLDGAMVYIGRANQWKIREAYRDYKVRLARGEWE